MMGSYSKLRCSTEGQEDRISNLPDDILSHILSFLPTKYAVVTSVLSSKWRYHWMTIDSVDFDVGRKDFKTDGVSGFLRSIEKVLGKLDSPNIQKFRLCFSNPILISHLLSCLNFLVSHNVQVLDLGIPFGFTYMCGPVLFRCETLKILKIRTDYVFNVPFLAECCPNLKVLHVWFNSGDDLSGKLYCRQLEELSINARPAEANDMTLKVFTPSLKRLIIVVSVELHFPFNYRFKVFAPELENLYVRDDALACSLVGDFPRLRKTSLDVGTTELHGACFDNYDFVLQPLSEVAHTKIMALTLDTTTALGRICYKELPRFRNLACLTVTIQDYFAPKLLYGLLRASPNLQVLNLQMENKGEKGVSSKPVNWPYHTEVPVCLLQALKEVKILSFRGELVEGFVIKYLLGHGKVLSIMAIDATEPFVDLIFAKRILMLPRASKDCRVEMSVR